MHLLVNKISLGSIPSNLIFKAPKHLVLPAHRGSWFSARAQHTGGAPSLPVPPPLKLLETGDDMEQARTWIAEFGQGSIPRTAVELTFSRSSGPGGQNVNKVNTKATLRCPLSTNWIPGWSREHIMNSPYYAPSTHSILLTSTVHRSQSKNIDECLSKLRALVIEAASKPLRNEPSAEQKERVRKLEKAQDARRLEEKRRRSSLKQSRGKGGWD